ncbi:hypothetical protein [Paenibacillus ehimensis]|uniref:hypothetical protein n=1 Tax=Paenibacillus ehimensis TaxID=79264 RepID=UPI000472F280|nr:hypothetical protein [Paenibacillus ehimensis]
MVEQVRDLEADLFICEVAEPSQQELQSLKHAAESSMLFVNKEWRDVIAKAAGMLIFAREGWAYAIRRAQEAEAEVDRLRNELNILQEQLQQSGRCWD